MEGFLFRVFLLMDTSGLALRTIYGIGNWSRVSFYTIVVAFDCLIYLSCGLNLAMLRAYSRHCVHHLLKYFPSKVTYSWSQRGKVHNLHSLVHSWTRFDFQNPMWSPEHCHQLSAEPVHPEHRQVWHSPLKKDLKLTDSKTSNYT